MSANDAAPARDQEPDGRSSLDQACAAWRLLLGDERLADDEATLGAYANTTLPRGTKPAAVIWPTSSDEVAAIVRIARRYGQALYPISRGRNWGYGDACAASDDQVIVDLSRMDRIVEVDSALAYAVIEPGVTQGQLAAYLRDRGLPLWLDCTGAGPETSLVGNVLERGFGHTPYGNRSLGISGLEVVLGSGERLRSGFGHYDDAKAARLYPAGVGPALDGLFAQSSMGIVTQMGLWLMPKPESFCLFIGLVQKRERIAPVVEALRRLRQDGTLRSVVHIGNDLRALSASLKDPAERAELPHPLPADLREALRKKHGLAAWALSGGLYGRKDQVAAARRVLRRELGGAGCRLIFVGPRKLALAEGATQGLSVLGLGSRLRSQVETLRAVYDLHTGRPNGYFLKGAYWRLRAGAPARPDDALNPGADGCGLAWVSPVLPMTGEAVKEVEQIVERVFAEHGFDPFMTFSAVNERALGGIINVAYDKHDAGETERAEACRRALLKALMAAGYPPYRAGIADMAALELGSDSFWQTVSRLKSALDPDGVIAPGRYDPQGLTARNAKA